MRSWEPPSPPERRPCRSRTRRFSTTPALTPATSTTVPLPNIEVKNADDSQLFLVRITVPYDRVALLPPFWAKQLNLVGQAVMRHE